MSNHPITPPDELVEQWAYHCNEPETVEQFWRRFATQAAQWGADQQLEADCEWLTDQCLHLDGSYLRSAMRPKPLSDKEQALNALSLIMSRQKGMFDGKPFETVRRVLESL